MKINKILSVILAVAMILGTMTTLVFAEETELTINTAADLKAFAGMVNGGDDFAGKTVVLAQSIELPDEEWTAIGNGTRSSKSYSGSAFKGTFDGGNNTINGLKITSTTDADAAIGLFGVVDGGAVKNLKLANVNINVTNSNLAGGAIGLMVNNATAENIAVSGSVVGHDGVGGIVGRMVISGTIKDCTNNASVTSTYGGIGGVVGKAYYEDGANTALFANIVNCTNNGIITAPMYVGGIVGLARANITDCINNGAVVGGTQTGGIAGQLIAAGAVSKNENKAKITGKNHVGGIIGDYTQSNAYTYNNVSITNNVNRGELEATEQCAAILGCNNIDGFTDMVASGNRSFYNADGLELFGNPEDMTIDKTNMFVEKDTVAIVGGKNYTDIKDALKAVTSEDNVVDILKSVTITDKWDCRYTGAKIIYPVTINGNGNTLKFTGDIFDSNWNTIFRFEEDATVMDLTIDASEATSIQRGITGKGNLTVENFTFIGNGTTARYGVIYGEGSGTNIGNITATITGSDFANCSYGVSDNRNDQDAKKVTVSDNTFTNAKVLLSAANEVVFTDNKVDNGSVVIRSFAPVTTVAVTATGNTLDESFENSINADTVITDSDIFELPVVDVNGKTYLSIAEAIEAAKAIANPVITIFAGTYDAFEVPAELNNVKFIGETDTNGNNLVTIKTLEKGIATHTGGVYVQPETATFENLNFTAGDVSVNPRVGGMASSLGKANGDTGMSSNLTNLIIKGCNFTGSGAYQAIWTNVCDVTIIDTTIKNYSKALYSCAIKANQKIAVENSEITDVTYALHLEEATSGSELNVEDTAIDAVVIALGGAVAMNITKSEIRNAEVAIWGSSVNISESKLYDTTYSTNTDNSSITINSSFANNVDALIEIDKAYGNIAFVSYYPTEKDLEAGTNLTNADKTSGIAVTFVKDTEDSTGRTYKIVLKAEEGSINDFESAHFTFVNKSAGLDYAITPNTAANITAVDDITNENRISFYMNADENKPVEISGNEIILGTVAFGGYGDADFSIDKADAKVNATTVVDSIVETFTPNSTTNKLYVNWTDADTTDEFLPYINVEDLFVEQARKLYVDINFNNDITSQSADYTEMKVEVTGQNGEKHLGLVGDEPSVKYDAEMVCATVAINGKSVTLPFTVTAGYRYTVKVSGAGYRTAEYTTVIPVLTPEEYATDEGITLTFWNNVKDEFNKTEIESGSDRWYTKNFLAGEIVQDNKINKYDLAAVVSYFGEDKLVENRPEYNKYDLNRDGVIDSEDIAYVLVSFGE